MVVLLAGLSGCGGGDEPSTGPTDAQTRTQVHSPGEVENPVLYQDATDGTLSNATRSGALPTVIGEPGQTADCAETVPCRWVSADGGFAVTVTRADNTGRDGRLELQLEITSTHDTTLDASLATDAIDNSGRRTAPVRVTLGDNRNSGAVELPAGQVLAARIDFDAAAFGTHLPDWNVRLNDNGSARQATFANLPHGPMTGPTIDCGGVLPCIWTSDDLTTTVALVVAGGFASARRLHVDFRVSVTEPLALLAGPETVATAASGGGIGTAGRFEVRALRLGGTVVDDSEGVTISAGAPVAGRVDFFRTVATPAMLATLALDLYRDAPVPRWRPSFANVPALTP